MLKIEGSFSNISRRFVQLAGPVCVLRSIRVLTSMYLEGARLGLYDKREGDCKESGGQDQVMRYYGKLLEFSLIAVKPP